MANLLRLVACLFVLLAFNAKALVINGCTIEPNTDCVDADLSYSDLSNANLSGADLSNANLTGANLSGVNLLGANLSGATLMDVYGQLATSFTIPIPGEITIPINYLVGQNITLPTGYIIEKYFIVGPGVNLTGADLSNADLSGIDLTNATLVGVSGRLADATGITLPFGYIIAGNYIIGSGVNLSNADLYGSNLNGADLSGSNLSSADLGEANLSHAILSNADLSGASLWSCNLSDANLSGADISNANIAGAIFNNVNLSNADISGVNLCADMTGVYGRVNNASGVDASCSYKVANNYVVGPNVNLINADLSNADLSYIDFESSDLTGVNLDGANIHRAYFDDATLDGVFGKIFDPPGALPYGFRLPQNFSMINNYIVGPKVNLSNTNLSDANLSGAYLWDANLSGADFSNANLSSSYMDRANFSSSILINTDFSNSSMTVVDFSNANISGANLQYTNLSNAIFLGATGQVSDTPNINLPTGYVLENLFIKLDFDKDGFSDETDADIDGDGTSNIIEQELGFNALDPSDGQLAQIALSEHLVRSLNNSQALLDRDTDTDEDGISDALEIVLGGDPNDANDSGLLNQIKDYVVNSIGKSVPAMGGIGLLALGLSMLGLGAVRLRKK